MKAILAILLFCASALAQNYVTITAANIVDASGNLLAAGTIVFSATDANGKAISYQPGGGGQTIRFPVSCSVANGAIISPTPCQLANVALTAPANICFNTVVKDTLNRVVIGGPNTGYTCLQPTTDNTWCAAGVCNFDNFVPGNQLNTTQPFSIEFELPTTNDNGKFLYPGYPKQIKVTKLTCNADNGTVSTNFEIRNQADWTTSLGTLLSTPLACTSVPINQTNFATSIVPANSPLALMIPATSGTPTMVRVRVYFQVQ